MLLGRFLGDRSGSATRWFAYAAVIATVLSVAGAQGLSRLPHSGLRPVIAFVPARSPAIAFVTPVMIDPTPTGSVAAEPRVEPRP